VATRKERGYWKVKYNQRVFFDQIAEKLNIKKPEDWKNVKLETVASLGGSSILRHYGHSLVRGIDNVCCIVI
jgi:hypothetical protein